MNELDTRTNHTAGGSLVEEERFHTECGKANMEPELMLWKGNLIMAGNTF